MKKTSRKLLAAALLLGATAINFTPTRAQQKPDAKPAAAATTPAPAATPQAARGPQKIVREGVEIEFTVEPSAKAAGASEVMAGRDAVVRFRVRDTATGTPLSGVRPAAWASRRSAATPPDAGQCREKVQSYLQGSLRARPDVDLNAYYLLALNQEPNLSVIDPLLGFGGSKLVTLVMLKSPGEDWVLTPDRSRLFVSMPLVNAVAVVDTTTWKVVSEVGAGVRPTRLALQPDGKYLWVANEGAGEGEPGGVTAVDTASLKVAANFRTGAGAHEIAFAEDNGFAFVTNRNDGTLSVIDVRRLEKLKDVKTGAPASALAYSSLSKALYVANEADGSIAVVDSRSHELLTRMAAEPGLKMVRFAPGGRWGFVPNAARSVVHIFDASTNRLAHSVPVGTAPDQVAFTEAFAYVRSLGTEEVSAIRLATVGKEPDVVKFPGGQAPPGAASTPSRADAFAPAPEGGSMLIANPADRMIYYYSEGMAAPMGNFQNYKREPRALKVVDRSLREESLGVYATTMRLPKDGTYDVSFLISSPRVVHCFEATAKPDPDAKPEQKTALRVEYLNKEQTPPRAGESYKIRFKLTDAVTGQPKDGLKDVRVLFFLTPGVWQKRDFASPVGGGVYELEVNVPRDGVYMIFVESQSQGVSFRQLPYMTLQTASGGPAAGVTK
ncbi:MAG TPA: YncE family protein [Pyrinomonadaceae bacterium]